MKRGRAWRIVQGAFIPALAAWIAGCARPDPGGEAGPLVVFSASSLREASLALRERFVVDHPGARVEFAFAGSHELRAQLARGADADVLAVADEATSTWLAERGLVERPVIFAGNEPVVVVSSVARGRVRGVEDLPAAERIVLGVPEVPIGRYAGELLGRLGPELREAVEARVVSREFNTRQVLAKVRRGEADAAIVYRSDARIAPELVVVEVPVEARVVTRCTVALVTGARNAALAKAWVQFALGPVGQELLERAGLVRAPVPP